MNVVGIIAEYNPFHRGHAYQIANIKKQTGAAYVIAAMSGNFVQRGAPALTDKYSRAEMALRCGADLVLELPVLGATASAEYFARCGVFLLHNTGVVTHLCFGAESGNFDLLKQVSATLIQSPVSFQKYLKEGTASGLSFPLARSLALERCLTAAPGISVEELRQLLASPNNILAIEYLKALALYAPGICPCPVLRKGRGYHDAEIFPGAEAAGGEVFCSASAIRGYLQAHTPNCKPSAVSKERTVSEKTASADENIFSPELDAAIPKAACKLLASYPYPFLWEDDFSALVHYKLLMEPAKALAEYAGSSLDLANRMHRARHEFTSWSQFCGLLKTKNNTYTRISRLLLHLILDIKEADYSRFSSPAQIPYLRVLGFCRSSAPLLAAIHRHGRVPVVTSAADGMRELPLDARKLLAQDIKASDLYQLGLTAKGAENIRNDFRRPLVIL